MPYVKKDRYLELEKKEAETLILTRKLEEKNNRLRSFLNFVQIVVLIIAIIALVFNVQTFNTEIKMAKCDKLKAQNIKLKGLVQEIDHNIMINDMLVDTWLPLLIEHPESTLFVRFSTENMKANLDGSIDDENLHGQLMNRTTDTILINNRLDFLESPATFLRESYNISRAWEETRDHIHKTKIKNQLLRATVEVYRLPIESRITEECES